MIPYTMRQFYTIVPEMSNYCSENSVATTFSHSGGE